MISIFFENEKYSWHLRYSIIFGSGINEFVTCVDMECWQRNELYDWTSSRMYQPTSSRWNSMPRNFQGYTAKLMIKGTVIISVPSCTTIDYNIQLNDRNVFKQLREQVTVVHQVFPVVHQVFPVGLVTLYFTENFGALKDDKPKAFCTLVTDIKVKRFWHVWFNSGTFGMVQRVLVANWLPYYTELSFCYESRNWNVLCQRRIKGYQRQVSANFTHISWIFYPRRFLINSPDLVLVLPKLRLLWLSHWMWFTFFGGNFLQHCRFDCYRSGTLNSKFHFIQSFYEIFARFLSFHV